MEVDEPRARALLRADAAICAAAGIGTMLAAKPLGDRFGASYGVVFAIGAALLAWAVVLGISAAAQTQVAEVATRLAVVVNVAWIIATVVVLSLAEVDAVGTTVAIAAAVSVGALAWLELDVVRTRAARRVRP